MNDFLFITILVIYNLLAILVFIVMINIDYKKELNLTYANNKIKIWSIILLSTLLAPLFLIVIVIFRIITRVKSINQ